MTVDTDRLRRLASEATPGPWEWCRGILWAGATWESQGRREWETNVMEATPPASDAEYIAAANPTAVLALLDRIDELAAKVEWLEIRAGFRSHPDAVGGFSPGPDTDPDDL